MAKKRLVPLPNGERVYHRSETSAEGRSRGTGVVIGHFWVGDHLGYRIKRDNGSECEWDHWLTRKASSG